MIRNCDSLTPPRVTIISALPGARSAASADFHKKHTHLNNYIKSYGEPDYRPICDAMVEDVLGLQDDWCQWHECEGSLSLRAENEAINRVLSHCVRTR